MRRYVVVGIVFAASLVALVPLATAGTLPPGGTFSDDDGNVHEGAIEAIAEVFITLGCNPPVNDNYCPDDPVTREQMASFFVRSEGLTDDGGGDWFTDDTGSAHEEDINKLFVSGITRGCDPPTNDMFCPKRLVTRQEIASFIVRARGLTDPGDGDYFIDDNSSIHRFDIDILAAAGIALPCNEAGTRFCPRDPMRRDEMAYFLAKAYDLPFNTPPPRTGLKLDTVISSGLSQPLYLTAPAGDDRLFIVEKTGKIRVYKNGSLLATPFLDLSGSVSTNSERGLLGLVFHPDFGTNGRFFVFYSSKTDTGVHDSILAEYEVSDGDADVADPTGTVLLTIPQQASTHKGGMLAFGPNGNLFVSVGDGGNPYDKYDNSQDNTTLLGSMLRITVDSPGTYTVPADNPFVGINGADEIYAMGLRNPWRFSIDGDTIYLGDVGQYAREEINVFSATDPGLNFGWPRYEGTRCVKDYSSETTCDTDGMTFPIIEHTNAVSNSITGGYVYRGTAVGMVGYYFYGDYSNRYVKSALIIDGVAYNEKDWTSTFGEQSFLASFGVDGHGELYLISIAGTVKKLVPDI